MEGPLKQEEIAHPQNIMGGSMLFGKNALQSHLNHLIRLIIFFLIPAFCEMPAQEFGLAKLTRITNPAQKVIKTITDPIAAGTYTIGIDGDFPTIDSAFGRLSSDGILGPVTFELIDESYTSTSALFLNGPIAGASKDNRVTIRPAENKNILIEGNLLILNTSFLTIDGTSSSGSSSVTINSSYYALQLGGNSDHNILLNLTAFCENLGGAGIYLFVSTNEAPDSNVIQNNVIRKAGIGIYVSGIVSGTKTDYNIIRNNFVGSETDSLIVWGIQVECSDNAIIENNIVQNITGYSTALNYNIGINSWGGTSNIIRNNIVHGVKMETGNSSIGILLSGGSNYGIENSVYNNMVYDIQSSSNVSGSRNTGIQLWYQDNPKIYYNSVYLSGQGLGANPDGSAAVYVRNNSEGIDLRNNILVNTRDESPYCASAIYNYSNSNLTSDNNDLHYVQNGSNCIVKSQGNDYYTLEEWQATGHDINSISEMPNFIEPDLHIDETIGTGLESRGISITGIETDFEGDTRNDTSPDIGADEFEGFSPVQEWYQIAGPFPGMTYGRISVVDANIVWIAGGFFSGPPKVFRTVDGGLNWLEIPTNGLPHPLMAIQGKDSLTAFVGDAGSTYGGGNAKLFKTTDAGLHWILVDSTGGNAGFFDDLQFSKSNPQFGIATSDPPNGPGNDYLVEKTTDGGITWDRTMVPGQANSFGTYYTAYPIDADFYGFASYNVSNYEMKSYTTSDGGANWYLGNQGVRVTDLGATEIVFNDDKQHGIMFGVTIPSIMVTSDGGHDWTEVNTNMPISGFSTASWVYGTDIVFICSSSSSTHNTIIRSNDNGLTWHDQLTPDLSIVEIDYVKTNSEIIAYAVTSGGMVLKCNQPVNLLVDLDSYTPTISSEFTLEQNYPNPFNPATTIRWQSPESCVQKIKIYDILGNEVKTLVDEFRPAGTYEIQFDASALASGIYFYRMTAGNYSSVKKMILLK